MTSPRRPAPPCWSGSSTAISASAPSSGSPISRRRTNLTKLTDYCLRHYYGEEGGADAPARLLAHVAREAARLAASYIAAGFVHGVLNSDNIAITAQSFDYGPWRFTPYWDGHFTAAYFDHAGLYSFGRQPEAIHWDVLQLAASLRAIAEAEALTPSLDAFPGEFQRQLVEAIFARLRHPSHRAGARRGLPRRPRNRAGREDGGRSTASSSTGAAAGGGAPPRPTRPMTVSRSRRFARRSRGYDAGRGRDSAILIGRTRRPARCTSARSRRSGAASTRRTTGRPSMPRSRRSGGWARPCGRRA